MPDRVAREGAPVFVNGQPVYNAACPGCEAMTAAPMTRLIEDGWFPMPLGWYCPDCAPHAELWAGPGLPWEPGPNTLAAMFEPFPAHVRAEGNRRPDGPAQLRLVP